MEKREESRVIYAVAPVRVCDLGGWTDTWFAGVGAVMNIGVYPYAEVEVSAIRPTPDRERRIVICAENFGDRYSIQGETIDYDRHPLLEACIDIMELPKDLSFEVNLYSEVPSGCSTGTSAAISVALLGALDLLTPGRRTPHEIAGLAHRVETEKLGLQCGIQDQLCSAYGGICFIEMFQYPFASVSQVGIPDTLWWELERRLVLVFLGKTHSSSQVHRQVISRLESDDGDKSTLDLLRKAAYDGKDAIYAGDFAAFGRAMEANTEAQASLHPELVSESARKVIGLAKEHGAAGWKVNGAGGDGGSLTILCGPGNERKRAFIKEVLSLNEEFEVIPTYLSRRGIRRWIGKV